MHKVRLFSIITPLLFSPEVYAGFSNILQEAIQTPAQRKPVLPGNFIARGIVIDERSGSPLPYVNIGVPEKNLGTLSDPDGSFEISLLPSDDDSLAFSMVGYEKLLLPVGDMNGPAVWLDVKLKPSQTLLPTVTIQEKKLGKKIARLGWMGGKDGILPLDTVMGGGAVAMLVESPDAPWLLEKLQIRLMYSSKDTLQLRFHIYEFDSVTEKPGDDLLENEIILRETRRFGWLRYDLSDEKIIINRKKFFLGFEWIDTRETRTAMLKGLREWEVWKKQLFEAGSKKVTFAVDSSRNGARNYKYHGNMMDWPGFKTLPPFTGLMVESGKKDETAKLRTFERKTSFGSWTELSSTLNAVIQIIF